MVMHMTIHTKMKVRLRWNITLQAFFNGIAGQFYFTQLKVMIIITLIIGALYRLHTS